VSDCVNLIAYQRVPTNYLLLDIIFKDNRSEQIMTYKGRVQHGVVVLDGPQRPREGAIVRVEEESVATPVGQALDELAGQAQGLPADLAERHDQYRRERQ
jgi:hypothetical protein